MKPLHFLIADDLVDNRVLLQEIIEILGYTHQAAENGKRAIELLMQNDFDLIFMDIEMPVMNGMETTLHIRTKLFSPKRDIPIIAISAHNPENFWDMFKDSGFSGFIAKPFSVDSIVNLIDSLNIEK